MKELLSPGDHFSFIFVARPYSDVLYDRHLNFVKEPRP